MQHYVLARNRFYVFFVNVKPTPLLFETPPPPPPTLWFGDLVLLRKVSSSVNQSAKAEFGNRYYLMITTLNSTLLMLF